MWHQFVRRFLRGEARAPPAAPRVSASRRWRTAQLLPAALLLVLIGAGTATVFAARSHRAWLVGVGVVLLVGALAGLAASVMHLDRRMRRDEWAGFEEAFRQYVNRRESGGRHE